MKEKQAVLYDTDTDLMRIIAAFFVVLIHCSAANEPAAIVYNSISRFSVPVFVLISGYYTLSSAASGKQLARKGARLFGTMILWSFLYYLYGLAAGAVTYGGPLSLVRYLLTEPVHLWYLYAHIGLLLLTPLLRVFHRAATEQEYRYGLLVTFGLGSVVLIALRAGRFDLLSQIVDKMKIPYTLGFVFCYLMGGYIRRFGVASRRPFYAAGLLGTVFTVAATLILSGDSGVCTLFLSFFAPNVLLASVAFFLGVRALCRRHPVTRDAARSRMHNAAACTGGIYLLHPMLISLWQAFWRRSGLQLPAVFWIPLSAAVVFLTALAVLWILRLLRARLPLGRMTRP